MRDKNLGKEIDYMARGNRRMTRRGFLKTSGVVGGFTLLGNAFEGFIPGPRSARGQEIPTIEGLTKGQIKVGTTINKDNVELVKELINSGSYEKVKRGAQMPIMPTRTRPEEIVPAAWLEVTERNKGRAVLDKNGQLWTKEGKPWIGGHPFPKPRDGLEVVWNFATQAGFEYADDAYYEDVSELVRGGEVYRTFENKFLLIVLTGRVFIDPKPYYPAYEKELYRLFVPYLKPFDFRGAGFLIIRPTDQTKLESTYAYLPALRRVRQLSTKQRWESSVGDDAYLSDYNFHNDPIVSWDWKLIEKRPMIGVHTRHYRPEGPLKEKDLIPLKGLPLDAKRFHRGPWELRPEVYVVEGRPTDAASPYSKKILYVDSVLLKPMMGDWYDRQGRLWKTAVFFSELVFVGGYVIANDGPLSFADLIADHVTNILPVRLRKNVGFKVEDWWTERAVLQTAF